MFKNWNFKDHKNKGIWILCALCIAVAVVLIIAQGYAKKLKEKGPRTTSFLEANSFSSAPDSYADAESYSSIPSVSEAESAASSVTANSTTYNRALPYLDNEQSSSESTSSSNTGSGSNVGTYSFPDSTDTGGDTRTNIPIDTYEGSYDLLSTYNDANADAMKQKAEDLVAEKTPVEKISSIYYVNVPSGRYVFVNCGNTLYAYNVSGQNGNYDFKEIPNMTEDQYDNILEEGVSDGVDE